MMAVIIVAFIVVFLLIFMYALYFFVFHYPNKLQSDAHNIPDSVFYKNHRERMLDCIKDMENTPFEEVCINAKDGCKLFGKLYIIKENAPVMLFFHGYHGMAEWDGYGSFRFCMANGINILMTDERAHGKSEGKIITFGVNEKYDCKLWTEYIIKRFGEQTDIILSGLSMGAASVMMYSALGLPDSVKAIISDCGYSEASTIIKEIIRKMRLPVKPLYFIIKMGARIFGKFDLEETTPVKAVARLDTPILFIHGSKDSVVPLAMNDKLYQSCVADKERVVIEGADHSNCAMTDYPTYEKTVKAFIERIL